MRVDVSIPVAFSVSQAELIAAGSDRTESDGKDGSRGCHGQAAGDEKQHVNPVKSRSIVLESTPKADGFLSFLQAVFPIQNSPMMFPCVFRGIPKEN